MPPPPTGEHSLEETPVPIRLVWAAALKAGGAALALGTLATTAGVAHYRLGKVEEKQASEVARADAGLATLADHETRLRLEEEDRRQMRRLLEKMDGKMDRLLEGGTRTAGGHGR